MQALALYVLHILTLREFKRALMVINLTAQTLK